MEEIVRNVTWQEMRYPIATSTLNSLTTRPNPFFGGDTRPRGELSRCWDEQEKSVQKSDAVKTRSDLYCINVTNREASSNIQSTSLLPRCCDGAFVGLDIRIARRGEILVS